MRNVVSMLYLVLRKKSQNPKPKTHNQTGFTLVEILIVLSIIGITAAAAVPGLRRFGDDQKLDAASSNIVQVIKQAQSSAKSGIRCTTSGSTSTGKWTLELKQNSYLLKSECS